MQTPEPTDAAGQPANSLIQRARRAWRLHWLRARRAQLLQGIDTLEQCIAHDQALVAHMRRELAVIDGRVRSQAQSLTLQGAPL